MHAQVTSALEDLTGVLLTDTPCLSDALRHVTDTALRLVGCDHASVRLCGPDGRLEVGARSGVGAEHPAPAFGIGQGLIGWVAQTGLGVRVGNCLNEPRFIDRRERGFAVGSVLSVPVTSGGRTFGVLSVSSPMEEAFTDQDEGIARLLAGTAAVALRIEELQRLALTDSQTLAYNRRYLLPRLHQEMDRTLRQPEPLCLLLIDLDHFKRVNDRHGHAVGDVVLRAFADAVRGCVRTRDVLVRRGGEEFVLIMPATDEAQAFTVAERLRKRLASAPLYVRGSTVVHQTASIGVARWDCCEGPEMLEERADAAMYEAKRRGRNRVVLARALDQHKALLRALR